MLLLPFISKTLKISVQLCLKREADVPGNVEGVPVTVPTPTATCPSVFLELEVAGEIVDPIKLDEALPNPRVIMQF